MCVCVYVCVCERVFVRFCVRERKSKEKVMENMYMPPIAHEQNDVQTILRGTRYLMLYVPTAR